MADAVHGVIWETLERIVPGSGGLVAVDADGHVEMSFNTPGMYRGWIDENGAVDLVDLVQAVDEIVLVNTD